MAKPRRVNYLNNKDMLKEIHKSKTSFCEFTDAGFDQPDYIIDNRTTVILDVCEGKYDLKNDDELFDLFSSEDVIAEAKQAQATRIQQQNHVAAQKAEPEKKFKAALFLVDPDTILVDDLVFRVLTFNHIPEMLERKKTHKTVADRHIKLNFIPYRHFVIRDGALVEVGKSHHSDGEFSMTGGQITNTLAKMFMLLVNRYSERSNWRGYCVDQETEALTKRGWLKYNEINEDDTIMSFDNGNMKWSEIKSIYRDNFDGLMHKATSKGMDALITPNHKLVTSEGLKEIEYLLESDKVILMGNEEETNFNKTYSDSLVELIGWIVTEGCYQLPKNSIQIYQNEGVYAERIRTCLHDLGFTFSESLNKKCICFSLNGPASKQIFEIIPEKDLNMDLILKLTAEQRKLLIETMIDGDGWRVGKNNLKRYTQKKKESMDLFQSLCAISGYKTNLHFIENHISYGKEVSFYNLIFFSHNSTNGSCVDLHGGKRNGRHTGSKLGKGKINHPNKPTEYYSGTVWCPETEYGSFLARRNGKVYLTGNTYIDEMRGQALLQLSHMGLQFEVSRSNNPFAYFTAVLTNSFTRVLNIEKNNQNLRDNLLESFGQTPSFTRQLKYEEESRLAREEASRD